MTGIRRIAVAYGGIVLNGVTHIHDPKTDTFSTLAQIAEKKASEAAKRKADREERKRLKAQQDELLPLVDMSPEAVAVRVAEFERDCPWPAFVAGLPF